MGIDCPDVKQIIHWGVLESYLQETGQAGQDGLLSCAVLFHRQGDLGKKTSKQLKAYCTNTERQCRKKFLFGCIKLKLWDISIVIAHVLGVNPSFILFMPSGQV